MSVARGYWELSQNPEGASVDDRQRKTLEHEVEDHRARVQELCESLRDMEENLQQVVDAPRELLTRVSGLKLELRGRKAAIALGAACLAVDEA
jgi:chromosome segregation ATPase